MYYQTDDTYIGRYLQNPKIYSNEDIMMGIYRNSVKKKNILPR